VNDERRDAFDLSVDDNELIECCLLTLGDVTGDALSILERLGRALDVSVVVMIRRRGRGMVGECWQGGGQTRRVRVRRSALESATPAEAAALAAENAGAPPQPCWDAARAATTESVLGLGLPASRYSTTALTIVATCIEISLARELASITARARARRSDRALIASAIHQGAAQDVGALSVQLEMLDELVDKRPDRVHDLITELKSSVRHAQESLRAAIFDLTPTIPDFGQVDDAGPESLEPIVERFADEFSLEVSFVGSSRKVLLDRDTLGLLFAFAHEGLTNIRKHSTSKRGCVGVCVARGSLRLTVYDEGFHNEDLEPTAVLAHGHGLNLMRARARLLGGDVWLDQLNGGGTALTLEVPM